MNVLEADLQNRDNAAPLLSDDKKNRYWELRALKEELRAKLEKQWKRVPEIPEGKVLIPRDSTHEEHQALMREYQDAKANLVIDEQITNAIHAVEEELRLVNQELLMLGSEALHLKDVALLSESLRGWPPPPSQTSDTSSVPQ